MKKSNKLPRVWFCSRNVRTFVPVAVKASEGEILKNGLAYMVTRNDVIDVEGQTIKCGGKATIFASALSTFPGLPGVGQSACAVV